MSVFEKLNQAGGRGDVFQEISKHQERQLLMLKVKNLGTLETFTTCSFC